MQSKSVQDLVKQIFSDEKAKSQFISDPQSVMSKFSLTAPEKRAILNTHAKLRLVTSNSQQMEAVVEPLANWFAPQP
jgi:hypothetical protein